jgi:hypothetical protein
MNTQDTLKVIDNEINNGFRLTMTDPYQLEEAIVYGVEVFDGERPMVVPLASHPDIYTLLDSTKLARDASAYSKFCVVTTGWAAPAEGFDEDGDMRPSEHPMARRVRVLMLADGDVLVSSYRFGDTDEVIYNEESGNGRGSLQDAVEALIESVQIHRNQKARKGYND